jgi:L-glutamine-phosphate cytidylyltransferase
MKAVILAAGVGSRLAPLTNDRPKALVPVLGKSMLERQLEWLERVGIAGGDVVIVGGYRIEQLAHAAPGCTIVANGKYDSWGNFYSVLTAEPHLRDQNFLQLDGDVILDDKILPRMVAASGDASLAVDTSANLDDDAMKVELREGRVHAIDKKLDATRCAGEYIGVTKISSRASRAVFRELAALRDEGITHEYYEHAFHRLCQRGELALEVVRVDDCQVLEIDDHADLLRAEAVLRQTS